MSEIESTSGTVNRSRGSLGAARSMIGRIGAVIRETLLTLAALGGVVCIILVILAFTGGFSLIMFKTGSMSPTIPAGSVALVKEIPASDVAVGDVLTVDRAGELPVTHRVTGIAEGSTTAERIITMRGDDNDVDDPEPYVIEQGRIVVGSVPHLASVIVWFGSPWVLGGIAIAASVLVTWAFWPREPKTRGDAHPIVSQSDSASGSAGDQAPCETADTAAAVSARSAGRHGALLLIVGVVAAASATAFTSAPAQAADALMLRSDLETGVQHTLNPTEPLLWHIDVDASAAPRDGELAIATSGLGDVDLGMRVQIRSCAEAWSDGSCASGASDLVPESEAQLDESWRTIMTATTPASTHLQIALTAVPSDAANGSESADLTVRATAGEWSEEVSAGGAPELPRTGAGVSVLGLVFAPLAVLAGITVAWLARGRESSRGRERGSSMSEAAQ